ncbi:protein CC2D2B-like [Pieris napi]|uniref:protein CC2D2B-like n=1 Tax=Pieris napi TaxID=78633 RepID=UPI001FBBCFB8|nr:protein CC2D2B-like [Pieris napi]
MGDKIELHSYRIRGNISDSEEYHEINESAVYSENLMQTVPQSPKTQTFFFTKQIKKNKRKRVNKERTDQSSNILKIVTKKIDSESSPIVKNVINVIKPNSEPSYLQSECRLDKILQYKPHIFDVEHGDRQRSLKLHPNFPNGEKTSETRDTYIFTNYVEPRFFKDFFSGRSITNLNVTQKFLDISINGLNFTYHHSYSLEKILSIKLEEYYMDYLEIEKHIIHILRGIDVNRQTRENLKAKFTAISTKKNDSIRFDATILKYTAAFLDFKEKYYYKLNEKRKLLCNILSLWSDIKSTRHKLGVINTPIILEVEKLYVSVDTLAEHWKEVFQKEYTDFLIELEYDYVNKYLEYKQFKSDENYDKNKLVKPKLQIDPERIKHDVEKRVGFLVSPEDVSVRLKFDETIQKVKPNTEIQSEEKYIYLKVFIDDVFVCESERLEVKDISAINYNDSFTLQILDNNKTLTFILCEGSKDISALTMELDEIRRKYLNSVLINKHFVCYNKIKPTSLFIGNGYTIKDIAAINDVMLKSNNLFQGKLLTSCEIKLSFSWNDTFNANEKPNISLKYCLDVKKQIQRILHGLDKPNLSTLLDILNYVYEFEIDDENIINSLKDMCKYKTKQVKFDFINNENRTRFKLLKLRNHGRLVNVIDKIIPLFDSQITTERLSTMESEDKEFNVEYFESQRANMDPIDLERYVGIKFIEKLNKQILTDLNDRLLRKTHKDVVNDYQDLSLRSIFSIKSNTSLATSSVAKQSRESELAKEQEIYITVLRAFNLLDRSDTEQEEIDESIAGYKFRPLRPFVRLNYNNESVQTCTAVGNNPTWNYTAKIKTKLEPLSSIYINVYDEHTVNISQELDQSFRFRRYNKWLGTLAIPISTVLNLGSLRGTFKITTAPIIFGYESAPKASTSVIPEIIRLMKKDTAFLTLRITTSLCNLGGLRFYNQPCDNDGHILRHLNNFVTEYLNEFPARNLSLTFIDSTGRHKCVTEFLQPLPLPEINLSDTKSMGPSSRSSPKTNINAFELTDISQMVNLAIRYVSLIPTYEVIQTHVVTLRGIVS